MDGGHGGAGALARMPLARTPGHDPETVPAPVGSSSALAASTVSTPGFSVGEGWRTSIPSSNSGQFVWTSGRALSASRALTRVGVVDAGTPAGPRWASGPGAVALVPRLMPSGSGQA